MTETDAAPNVPPSQPEFQADNDQATNEPLVNTDRRNTVLENHGYRLGRTIGSGSYAMVKVIVLCISQIMCKDMQLDVL